MLMKKVISDTYNKSNLEHSIGSSILRQTIFLYLISGCFSFSWFFYGYVQFVFMFLWHSGSNCYETAVPTLCNLSEMEYSSTIHDAFMAVNFQMLSPRYVRTALVRRETVKILRHIVSSIGFIISPFCYKLLTLTKRGGVIS